MSATEALRTELDTIQLAKQQLEVENLRLREENPDQAAVEEALAEHGQLLEEQRCWDAENRQLRTLYDHPLRDSQEDQCNLEELREELPLKEVRVQEMEARCEKLQGELAEKQSWTARVKWEAREARINAAAAGGDEETSVLRLWR